MSRGRGRDYDPAFKLKVVARLDGGTNVSELSRELGIKRTLLYRWWDAWKQGGPDGLRRRGRPRTTPLPVTPPATASDGGSRPVTPVPAEPAKATAVALATPRAEVPGGEAAALAEVALAHRDARTQDRPAAAGTGFFQASLAAFQDGASDDPSVDRRPSLGRQLARLKLLIFRENRDPKMALHRRR